MIGDVTQIEKLPDDACRGIWIFEKNTWKNITKLINIFSKKYININDFERHLRNIVVYD